MMETAPPSRPAEQLDRGPGYDDDFFLWSQHQATLIRAGRFELVDWANVAEEVESLRGGDLSQLGTRLDVLITQPPTQSKDFSTRPCSPGPIDET